jgi:hypothetical protein
MPQQLPVGKSVTSGDDVVLQRPELAAQMASIISNWTQIEEMLLWIYGLLMGDYLPQGLFDPNVFTAPPSHPMARQIFDEVNSLNARLSLVAAICDWRLPKEDGEHFRAVLLPEIRRRSGERNKVAHQSWGVCNDYPDALILSAYYGPAQIWKMRDFRAVSDRIIALHSTLSKFIGKAYRERYQRINPHAARE